MPVIAVVANFVLHRYGVHLAIHRTMLARYSVSWITAFTLQPAERKVNTMAVFDFTLKFALPELEQDAADYIEQLGAAGCDDAMIGVGIKGRIALQFSREADTAFNAVFSALEDVKQAIPGVRLTEATPDLVGLSDIAIVMGVSRQSIRKLMLAHSQSFPAPIHSGSTAIWHLSSVLQWFQEKQNKRVEQPIQDIAQATMQLNIAREMTQLDPGLQSRLLELAR
ncbi:helix-turn-helix transcriptional regulator [Marinospirillum alkaliphilum]|nr:DNA-binding protein [Marinospirillum alkaliphilum]